MSLLLLTTHLFAHKMRLMNLLIRAPNWIGDAVMTFPALRSLKLNHPEYQIWVAARGWVKELYQDLDYINGIVPLPDSFHLKNILNSAHTIKKFNFDIGLLLTNSFSSALLFFAARIPNRWGYARDGRWLLLTKTPSPSRKKRPHHHVYYYLDLLEGLGLTTIPPELTFPVPEIAFQKAKHMLETWGVNPARPLIVFNPGASYGTAKQWPASAFAQLGAMLQSSYHAEIIIVGANSELDIGRSIASQMQKKPYVAMGKTSLLDLAGILKAASLVVTNDSGPMHLANAVHTPVVALFGPTDPQITGPLQPPSAVIKKEVPCWPCKYRECPLDHRCMNEIIPEEVFTTCQEFLK